MSNGHGGARPGAGRKTNSQIRSLRHLINTEISRSQWRMLIHNIFIEAQGGNLRAAQLLLQYRFGTSNLKHDTPRPLTIGEMLRQAE